MRTYRVHVHDHDNPGRELASADFTRRLPHPGEIADKIPVLNEPGRYEIRLAKIARDGSEIHFYAWMHDGASGERYGMTTGPDPIGTMPGWQQATEQETGQ